jgi:hypothetical protein
MRISHGSIAGANQASGSFLLQTKVHWAQGVTEPGSSGNPLLLASSNYRVIGTLSNGPFHSCSSNTGNVDWYSSFRDFYPEIESYLKAADPGPGPGSYGTCPASKAFSGDQETLEQLRAFRDQSMAASMPGRFTIHAYYMAAPILAEWVEDSPLFRQCFRAAARPFAYLGGRLLN